MHLTHLTIDGFGMLSDMSLPNLSNGLNVFHGANGAGKTTILQFLRGIFCGFGDARRMRLIPPLKSSHAGGSIGVTYRDARYSVIRHLRHDDNDALAINHTHGHSEDVPGLRKAIRNLDRDLFYTLFAVGSSESHAIAPLVRLALRDGIPLQNSTRPATWVNDRVEQLRTEREDLFRGTPPHGRLQELEQRRQQLDAEIQELTAARQRVQDTWSQHVEPLQERVTQLQLEINWLHAELQAAQSELDAVEDRLWSRRTEVVREERQVERPAPASTAGWVDELHAIDAQIVHLQQVLKDLAESRKQLSHKAAALAGIDAPEVETFLERQRASIQTVEQQTQHLGLIEQTLAAASEQQSCICAQLQNDIGQTLLSVRQQLYLICQELSRQQGVHAQVLINTQRASVDQCEREVLNQIQQLRLRRDALLFHPARTASETLQHRTRHEAAYCGCEEHSTFVNGLPRSVVATAPLMDVVVTERTHEVSAARPGDTERAQQLRARRLQLWSQWQTAQSNWCAAQQELATLMLQPREFAEDQSLQRCRYEYTIVEQQLADAREQWQSLAMLQCVLQGTQKAIQEETCSPVIEHASGLLKRLTLGRYPRFHFEAESQQLLVVNESGQRLPAHALSRGTLDQAALALRLVLWNYYVERGMCLPLVLDDVLNDSDEQRLQVAVEILTEFGATGQQILFFTCQEHLANLFAEEGATVRDLPGSTRRTIATSDLATAIAPVLANRELPPDVVAAAATNEITAAKEITAVTETIEPIEEAVAEYSPRNRTQPDAPYWLQADSPLMNVPSLSAQMVRRLGSLGVRHVADLVDLDPEATDIPLDSLQISATTLRQWQAECRLLTCVPDLTGRDAQVLVLVGIMSPAELAEAHVDSLVQRLVRVRQESAEHVTLTWLSHQTNWPDADSVRQWTRAARQARSFRSAREWSATPRRHRLLSTSDQPRRSTAESGHHNSNRVAAVDIPERISRRSEPPRMSLVTVESMDAANRELRFFLNLDSPIVDAPSIGPKMARRLEKIGVCLVSDLLNREADLIAEKLDHSRTNSETVRTWQLQSSLMCAVPEMRGHDVQILVACDVVSAKELAAFSPAELFAIVGPFVATKEGQRLLRSSKVPDLQEVTDWISYANHSRTVKAA